MWFRSRCRTRKPSTKRAARPRVWDFRSLGLERLEELCLPSFLSPVNYAASGSLVVTGDFTGDGRLDLAVANLATISVLAGNADGTFQPAVSSAGGAAVSMAAGDFNGDGKLDLVTASSPWTSSIPGVSIQLGNGNGTFQAPAAVPGIGGGAAPSSVAVGDFNADGKLDLGVASSYYVQGGQGPYGWYPGWYQDYATVLLGTGTGSFAASSTVSSYFNGNSTAAVADVNNDGKQDFILGGAVNNVTVHLGTGTGTLGAGLTSYVTYSAAARSMALGDVNWDGKLDAVTANNFHGLSVNLGNGLGGFSFDAASNFPTEAVNNAVALADFNGDGKLDVVATGSDGTVSVLLGTGTGTLRPPVSVPVATSLYGVATGDFNGDGRRDVAALGVSGVSVLLNDGVWPALDSPSVTVNNVTVTEGNTGATNATFTVSLSAASTQTVTVRYATRDGTATAGGDFQATSGTLTFAPGTTSLTITVPVFGDRLGEGSGEAYSLILSDPTNAFLADATGSGSILDDEPVASIDYGPAIVTEGNTGTTNATFTIRLAAAYDAPVRVNYSTFEGDTDFPYWGPYGYYGPPPAAMAGTDFETKAGTVTFAPGEMVKTVVVAVKGDVTAESEEYFSLNLTDSPDATLSGRHAVGVISDDEPRVSVSAATVTEGNTGTKAMTFTVTLSAPPTSPVTVTYETQDNWSARAGSDYQAKSGTLTFGVGETSKTITVLVNGDRLGEFDEYFNLVLTEATGAMILNGYEYGYIYDNEPRMSISSEIVKEGNSGTKLMSFTVTLSAAYDQAVTVRFATENGSARAGEDYVAKSGLLTFNPGQTTKTFTVTIKGDKKKEYDEDFYVRLSNASSSALVEQEYGYGTIEDDDRPWWW